MKVFIENEADSDQKNLYNEKTLEYKKTVIVSRKYPYPYGFILDTTSGDGDNLDCFIITNQKLKPGEIYDCEPIGVMEQSETAWEPGKEEVAEQDNNILASLNGENFEITKEVKEKLTDFVIHVFEHIKGKVVTVGEFLDKESAVKEVADSSD